MHMNKVEIVNATYTQAQTPPVRNIPAPNIQLQQHIGGAPRDPKLKRR